MRSRLGAYLSSYSAGPSHFMGSRPSRSGAKSAMRNRIWNDIDRPARKGNRLCIISYQKTNFELSETRHLCRESVDRPAADIGRGPVLRLGTRWIHCREFATAQQ